MCACVCACIDMDVCLCVAELCNHQRATPASNIGAIVKMDEKIELVRI